MHTLADCLPEAEPKTLGDTLGDVEAEEQSTHVLTAYHR